MKVYLAGPMTGYEFFNFPAFDRYKHELTQRGMEVFSPADNDRTLLGKPPGWLPSDAHHDGEWRRWTIPGAPTLRQMLGMDLAWICEHAEAIVMMPGWEKSSGASTEHKVAVALGLRIHYLT